MQFSFIIQIKARNHHYYVLIFVLRVHFHISMRRPFCRTPTAHLATEPGVGRGGGGVVQVNKFEQVMAGGIPCDLSHGNSPLWKNSHD